MMKRYLISEAVTAREMTYNEACKEYEKVKTVMNNVKPDDRGFVVCHNRPLYLEWIPDRFFHGELFDSDADVLKFYSEMLEQTSEFMKKYSKRASPEHKEIVYNINRHLRAINLKMKRIV